jgi:hypothetical protein
MERRIQEKRWGWPRHSTFTKLCRWHDPFNEKNLMKIINCFWRILSGNFIVGYTWSLPKLYFVYLETTLLSSLPIYHITDLLFIHIYLSHRQTCKKLKPFANSQVKVSVCRENSKPVEWTNFRCHCMYVVKRAICGLFLLNAYQKNTLPKKLVRYL